MGRRREDQKASSNCPSTRRSVQSVARTDDGERGSTSETTFGRKPCGCSGSGSGSPAQGWSEERLRLLLDQTLAKVRSFKLIRLQILLNVEATSLLLLN